MNLMTPKPRPRLRRYGLIQSATFQFLLGMLFAVVLPWILYRGVAGAGRVSIAETNTLIALTVSVLGGAYMFRRFDLFPGLRRFAYVLPSFFTSFAIVFGVVLAGNISFKPIVSGLSFASALIVFLFICRYSRRVASQRFYVVPFGNVDWLFTRQGLDSQVLTEPVFPAEPDAVLVVDLRANLDDRWERMIAETAISGHAVYHTKQLRESLEGRVEIEHLSENSFGSLLPNLNYRNVKRLGDILLALVILPFAAVATLLAAPLIKLSSPGPVLFQQERMGHRGERFTLYKLRTMRASPHQCDSKEGRRDAAMTKTNDGRITALGRFLRRSRIDELPQVVNVLKGDMSFIGPRPEAVALADWYEDELPFYTYRHIVRPGITGWAQVNQGHVAELDDVREKLHYDFYYIKNFSAWLDLLIVLRTMAIVATGFGSK